MPAHKPRKPAGRRVKGEGTIYPYRKGFAGQVTLPDGTRRTVYGKTKDEVSGQILAIRQAVANDEPLPKGRETVAQYLEEWYREIVVPSRTLSTARGYASVINSTLIPALGKYQLSKLSPQVIQGWITEETASGLAPRTIAQHRAVLRSALSWAVATERLTRNAARAVRVPSVPKDEITPLTAEQARQLVAACFEAPGGLFLVTTVATGLRSGELRGLMWADVDLERRTLVVRQKVVRIPRHGDSPGGWAFEAPKSYRSRRPVALPALAVAAIAQQRHLQEAQRALMGNAWPKLDLVFTGQLGQPLHYKTVLDQLRAVLAKHKLPRQTVHQLRHACASLAIAGGASLQEVSEMLGHADIVITAKHYSHLYDEARRATADRLDTMLGIALRAGPVDDGEHDEARDGRKETTTYQPDDEPE